DGGTVGTTEAGLTSVALADLDQDGNLDLIEGINSTTVKSKTFRNLGATVKSGTDGQTTSTAKQFKTASGTFTTNNKVVEIGGVRYLVDTITSPTDITLDRAVPSAPQTNLVWSTRAWNGFATATLLPDAKSTKALATGDV